ncbi:MAG: hypothetical protein M1820_003008 [Bogoriella megaspora]|nr:MAG: hypothetical protein M1820_003008 [Bogoriella megaspora]
MAEPLSVVGAISACVDLADRIASLVEKLANAKKRIAAIARDVSLLQSILKQLKEVLEPDPHAGYTAVRLTPAGHRNSLEAVRRCSEVFTKIRELLDQVLDNKRVREKLDRGDPINLDWLTKWYWIFKEGSIAELREELKSSKENVILSLSVNQLAIARQPVQLHPLDQRELDRLRVMIELLVTSNTSKASQPTTPANSSMYPLLPQPGSIIHMSTTDTTLGGGNPDNRSIGSSDLALYKQQRIRIDRIPRELVSPQALDQEGFRWINDPFDYTRITVYEDLSDEQLIDLLDESVATRASRHSSYDIGERLGMPSEAVFPASSFNSLDRDSYVESEQVVDMDGTSILLPSARLPIKIRRECAESYEAQEVPPSSMELDFDPTEDIVESLINKWTITAEEGCTPEQSGAPQSPNHKAIEHSPRQPSGLPSDGEK